MDCLPFNFLTVMLVADKRDGLRPFNGELR